VENEQHSGRDLPRFTRHVFPLMNRSEILLIAGALGLGGVIGFGGARTISAHAGARSGNEDPPGAFVIQRRFCQKNPPQGSS
jgi:hypothetical protein